MSEQSVGLGQEFGSWDSDPADPAFVANLQQSANLANENCDRAVALAHKLSAQLREAQDRINQLEREADGLCDQLLAEAKAVMQEVQSNADARVNRTTRETDERIGRLIRSTCGPGPGSSLARPSRARSSGARTRRIPGRVQ